ncbi:Toll/interleukin-1 receptor domain-containing protein [Tanacetum coccineum]
MDRISHMDVKCIWGNSNYQFVSCDSAGNSGRILCIWEANVFKKANVTISDNFIAIYGTWSSNNLKVLIVVVYASQSSILKRALLRLYHITFNNRKSNTVRPIIMYGEADFIIANHIIIRALCTPGVTIHCYDKPDMPKHRKMGHITIVGLSMGIVKARVKSFLKEGSAADIPGHDSGYAYTRILCARNLEAEEDDAQPHTFFNLHDPLSHYRCKIPELLGKRIQGCFFGCWALLSSNRPRDVTWSLWNPITSEIINLPPLNNRGLEGDYDDISYCCLSAPPDHPRSSTELFTIVIGVKDKTTFSVGDVKLFKLNMNSKDQTISVSSIPCVAGTNDMLSWTMLECTRLEDDHAHLKQEKDKGDEIVVRSVKGDHEVEINNTKDGSRLLNSTFRVLKND